MVNCAMAITVRPTANHRVRKSKVERRLIRRVVITVSSSAPRN
ncbi:hypothetical protein N136_02263 [Leifsonia aquatica ATCC 14665]|uniref:Uncharacterized protein n=1 Tax=Leifsonia aquatica ATCC 14665 TaxID=1358026 RepID=U2T1M0_LEIAQ|nr:hypothetical protein N136_02263 [Leifsonia aquatica ATCC 14665]